MMEQSLTLIKYALEQVPALTVVCVLLYVFLKAFERVVNKMTQAFDSLHDLYKETLRVVEHNTTTLARYEDGMQDLHNLINKGYQFPNGSPFVSSVKPSRDSNPN